MRAVVYQGGREPAVEGEPHGPNELDKRLDAWTPVLLRPVS